MNLNLKQISITFSEKDHRYTLNNEWVPGVTTITGMMPKPFLVPWAAKITTETIGEHWKADRSYSKLEIAEILSLGKSAHGRKKDLAADSGSMAHQFFSQFIKTGKYPDLPEDKEAHNAVLQFQEWIKTQKNIEWLGAELILASEKYKFAGCADAVAMIDNKFTLLDWKTSNFVDISFHIQLGGYAICLEELGSPPIEQRLVVRFPKQKDKTFEVYVVPSSLEEDKRLFLACLELYRYTKKYEKKEDWRK